MSPVEQAKALHVAEAGPRSFREDMEAHLLHGLVMCTPTAFILARYVSREWPAEWVVNPWKNEVTCARLDCLHIYLAAGDIREFFTFPHNHARWISFERRHILRFHPYAILQRRCKISQDLTSPPI